jgi:hypothetical protein
MFDANSDADKKFSQFPAQPTMQRSVSAPAGSEHVRITFSYVCVKDLNLV